jgi:hypothetical protein
MDYQVDTGNYFFGGTISWTPVGVHFSGQSIPSAMDLVKPASSSTQKSFLAPLYSQGGFPRIFSFGIPSDPMVFSQQQSDWQDGTSYTALEQFVNPANSNTVGGCTKSVFKAYDAFRQQLVWHRVSGATPDLEKTDILGQLLSADPGIATDINRATVRLYSQPNGPVRDQPLAEETGEEFQDYLDDNLTMVQSVELTTNEDGAFVPFNESGKFILYNVPVFARGGTVGKRPIYREQRYAIEIVDAQSDVTTAIPEGGTETVVVSYDPKLVTNLNLADGPFNIELLPFIGSVQVKRSIAEAAGGFCSAYLIAENPVLLYLNQIDSGAVELTEARAEGVERAIMAERAVLFTSRLAEEALKESIGTFATLIGDLISEIDINASAGIQEAQSKFGILQDQKAAGGSAWINVSNDELRAAVTDKSLVARLRLGQFAAGINASLFAAKPFLVDALVAGGMVQDEAELLASGTMTILASVPLKLIESESFGSVKGAAVLLVTEVLKSLGPQATDLVCGLLDDHLTYSSDQMQNWVTVDDTDFASDRKEIYRALSDYSSFFTTSRVTAIYEAAIAEGLGNAEGVYGTMGIFFKQAKAAEKGAKYAKYGFNLAALLNDVTAGLLGITEARRLAELAFNDAPLPANSQFAGMTKTSMASAANLTTVSIPDVSAQITDLSMDIDNLIVQLDGVDIENAVTSIFAGPDSLVATRESWDTALEPIALELGSVTANIASIDNHLAQFADIHSDYDFYSQSLHKILKEYVDALITTENEGTANPTYLVARDKLVVALQIYQDELNRLGSKLATIVSLVGFIDAGDIVPVVHASMESVTSNSTGLELITMTPETFTVSVRFKNLSDGDLTNLSANLLVSPMADVLFVSAATQNIPLLAAGTDTLVTWEVQFDGALTESNIKLLYGNLQENGQYPTSFMANTAMGVLNVDPVIFDSDLDGMSDAFEVANGLDPQDKNIDPDIDDDGLGNDFERKIYTSIVQADTDSDGLTDYEEVYGVVGGFLTDPLNEDTDGDGETDLSDPAPVDAFAVQPDRLLNPNPGNLSVDTQLVDLSADKTLTGINVSRTGDGELLWRAEVADPGLFQLSVGPGSEQQAPGVLFVAARGDAVDYDRAESVRLATRKSGST